MRVETAAMLRCCQKAFQSGDEALRNSAVSVLSYMQHKIMSRFVDLPEKLEQMARRVIAAAMEVEDG